jgi:hypothetical protein
MKDELELRPCQPPVQRDQDGPDLREAEEDLDVLMPIAEKDRDPVPVFDSHSEKEVTEPIGPLVDFPIGVRPIIADQRRLVRSKETPFRDPVNDGVQLDPLSVSPSSGERERHEFTDAQIGR